MSNTPVSSMTAFARHQGQGEWGSAVWELRSVNHRYLDLSLRLPEEVRELETDIRQLTRRYVQRGKLDGQLRFQRGVALQQDIVLNHPLLASLEKTAHEVTTQLRHVDSLRMIDVLNWPGVVMLQDIDIGDIKPMVLSLYEQSLQKLLIARQREGETLKEHLISRIEKMTTIQQQLVAWQPDIIKTQREALQQRLDEIKITVDEQRFEQEMVILAQKIDVTEELDRLQTHLNEVTRVITNGGVIGRRLDFFMQELNREVNTLAAKSIKSEVTQAAVELKVLIEQMREQVQNIE